MMDDAAADGKKEWNVHDKTSRNQTNPGKRQIFRSSESLGWWLILSIMSEKVVQGQQSNQPDYRSKTSYCVYDE